MKRFNILSIAILFICALSFIGCEGTCSDCAGCLLEEQNGQYCEGDFDSTDAYNQAITDLEAGGCECL